MTSTAKELWNSPMFLQKRIEEQTKYMGEVMDRMVKKNNPTDEWKATQCEYFLSASNLQAQFMKRLWEIEL